MSDIKWIKITTNMHEDEKMRLIDAMPERDTTHYVWIRLLVQAGKTNSDGFIFLNENIPYTDEMLATIFNRPLASIKLALKTLSDFEMIEVAPNNIIKILNWDKHQNIEGMERVRAQNRKRAENHREKKKQIEKISKENNGEEKQNNDNAKILEGQGENPKVKVKEDQGEVTKVSIQKSENIVSSDNFAVNSKADVEESGKNTENTNEDFRSNTNDKSNNIAKDSCNVTENESNVIVTIQNKKEIENKKKNKKEIDKDKNIGSKNNNDCDLNNKSSTCEDEVSKSSLFENNNTKSESAEEENINIKAMELMHYHEKITGKIGECDYVALRSAIDIHGEKLVKMAMDVRFEKNCADIKYAIGVLKNWRRDGYPRDDMEVKKNGIRSTGKSNTSDKNEFAGFKPKEPRKLTEAERKEAQEGLI